MVLGENLRVKALVGLVSIQADARATHAATYKGHWHERSNWPRASAETGMCLLSARNERHVAVRALQPPGLWQGQHRISTCLDSRV
jgi:hypothetical protein